MGVTPRANPPSSTPPIPHSPEPRQVLGVGRALRGEQGESCSHTLVCAHLNQSGGACGAGAEANFVSLPLGAWQLSQQHPQREVGDTCAPLPQHPSPAIASQSESVEVAVRPRAWRARPWEGLLEGEGSEGLPCPQGLWRTPRRDAEELRLTPVVGVGAPASGPRRLNTTGLPGGVWDPLVKGKAPRNSLYFPWRVWPVAAYIFSWWFILISTMLKYAS